MKKLIVMLALLLVIPAVFAAGEGTHAAEALNHPIAGSISFGVQQPQPLTVIITHSPSFAQSPSAVSYATSFNEGEVLPISAYIRPYQTVCQDARVVYELYLDCDGGWGTCTDNTLSNLLGRWGYVPDGRGLLEAGTITNSSFSTAGDGAGIGPVSFKMKAMTRATYHLVAYLWCYDHISDIGWDNHDICGAEHPWWTTWIDEETGICAPESEHPGLNVRLMSNPVDDKLVWYTNTVEGTIDCAVNNCCQYDAQCPGASCQNKDPTGTGICAGSQGTGGTGTAPCNAPNTLVNGVCTPPPTNLPVVTPNGTTTTQQNGSCKAPGGIYCENTLNAIVRTIYDPSSNPPCKADQEIITECGPLGKTCVALTDVSCQVAKVPGASPDGEKPPVISKNESLYNNQTSNTSTGCTLGQACSFNGTTGTCTPDGRCAITVINQTALTGWCSDSKYAEWLRLRTPDSSGQCTNDKSGYLIFKQSGSACPCGMTSCCLGACVKEDKGLWCVNGKGCDADGAKWLPDKQTCVVVDATSKDVGTNPSATEAAIAYAKEYAQKPATWIIIAVIAVLVVLFLKNKGKRRR